MTEALTLDDILDLRAYERVREEYRGPGDRPQAPAAGWRSARS